MEWRLYNLIAFWIEEDGHGNKERYLSFTSIYCQQRATTYNFNT